MHFKDVQPDSSSKQGESRPEPSPARSKGDNEKCQSDRNGDPYSHPWGLGRKSQKGWRR